MIVAGHQQITREWWDGRKEYFDLYVSQLVIDEVGAGDAGVARERLRIVREFPLLDITTDVIELATAILTAGKIPKEAAADAAHIAIAAVHGMDFLITWNCVHIANAVNAKALRFICQKHGYESPVICTPEELMGT